MERHARIHPLRRDLQQAAITVKANRLYFNDLVLQGFRPMVLDGSEHVAI
jgi:hypothetical protein